MLNYEKIKEISAREGVLDIVVEKDYILDWVLWGIYQNEYLRNNLVFKGGTALHKMYFSNWRFSEDLDFTTVNRIRRDELKIFIEDLCKKVSGQSGINLRQKDLVASGDNNIEWSFEIKIEYRGPRGQKGNLPTILLHITNDELLEDKPIKKMLIAPYPDLPENFVILTYSLEEILSEKIRTIFYQRCWPRDVYDTWRLLREVGNHTDVEKVLDICYRKSAYRGFDLSIPSNIEERILRLKRQWKEGLQRQISSSPDFDIVCPEVIELIKKLFENYNQIKKGGFGMLETHYFIKYKKGDLEIEVGGDKNFVEEKFKELLGLKYEPPPKREIKEETPVTEIDRKMSVVEFLKAKSPKSHGDKILVFGYFLEKFRECSPFNLNDIEICYKEARLPKTKNFRPYITQLIRDGYLMDAEEKKDSKKSWVLTDSGLKYVEGLAKEEE